MSVVFPTSKNVVKKGIVKRMLLSTTHFILSSLIFFELPHMLIFSIIFFVFLFNPIQIKER
jgi:ABC-type multidrug transport system permease subunit